MADAERAKVSVSLPSFEVDKTAKLWWHLLK